MTQLHRRVFLLKAIVFLAGLVIFIAPPRQVLAIQFTVLGAASGNVDPVVSVNSFQFIYSYNWTSGGVPEPVVTGVYGWQSIGSGAMNDTITPGSSQSFLAPGIGTLGLYANPNVTGGSVALVGTYTNASSQIGLMVALPTGGGLPIGQTLDTFLNTGVQNGAVEDQFIADVQTGNAATLEADFLSSYPALSFSAISVAPTELTFVGFSAGTNEGTASYEFASAAPEPASLGILLVGGLHLLLRRRRSS